MSADDTICTTCGSEVRAGALFCSKCGADVTLVGADAATIEVTTSGTPAPRIQSTMRQILREATLGEYEILSELGRGGMATVFLAHDISLDRKVAIKVMAPHLLEGEGMTERFKLEARTAAQLSHPHIIPIYAVKETESTLFFVMKFVEGKPLDDIIKRTGQLPIPMVKDILTKVGSALGYAHRRGVVHRDVKPGNVMIDEEGTPIVTDFGIAKVAETKGLTMTGTAIGTPTYMSPEQCEAKEVTGASDQYSLGVVAWEMLTGSTPFAGDSAVNTMYKHCHEPLPPLSDFRPDSPPEVLETVTRMLAKAPSDRWPSLEAAIRKLGSTTQDQLDPIRRELLELAKDSDARELIERLSTPRSPMPSVQTAARTGGSTGPGAPAAAAPAARRSWFPVFAGAFVAVAATVGTLAVLQPWSSGGSAVDGGTVPSVGAPAGGGGDDAQQDREPLSAVAGEPESGGGDGPASGGPAGDPATGVTPAGAQGGRGAGGPAGDAGGPQGGNAQSGGTDPPAGGSGDATPGGRGAAQPPAQAGVTSVLVEGQPAGTLEPGDQVTLRATPMGAGGATDMSGRAPRWSVSPSSIGTVNQAGVFTAAAPGIAVVTATIDGVSANASITVVAASVTELAVQPSSVTLARGERATLTAQPRARNGAVDAAVSWQSDAPGVATVSAGGLVEGVGRGTATITARAGGASRTATVTVMLDARSAADELLATYARAIESRDIDSVRRAYPNMTAEQEQNFRQALPNIERATMRILSFEDQGNGATATVEGTYGFNINGRRSTSEPFQFRASFRRIGAVWELSGIQ